MEKKVILFCLLVCLIPFAISLDTIEDYTVRDPVPLGLNVTAYGLFQDDLNVHANVLCSFYLLDSDYTLVDRADDQYTDSMGYFMSEFWITEPNFKRDNSFVLRTVCGGATEDSNFNVAQRESIASTGQQEFNWFTEPENTDTVFIWGIFILIAVFVIFILVSVSKYARSK